MQIDEGKKKLEQEDDRKEGVIYNRKLSNKRQAKSIARQEETSKNILRKTQQTANNRNKQN